MDSKKIEEKDIKVGKWYWHYELDRPVFLIYITKEHGIPHVLIPTISYKTDTPALYTYEASLITSAVSWGDIGNINVSPNCLDF